MDDWFIEDDFNKKETTNKTTDNSKSNIDVNQAFFEVAKVYVEYKVPETKKKTEDIITTSKVIIPKKKKKNKKILDNKTYVYDPDEEAFFNNEF